MKLSDLMEFDVNAYTVRNPGRGLKIRRPEVVNRGNSKIVYLGTDAIQRPHSGPQASPPGPKVTVPKIDRKKLRIKRTGRLGKNSSGETLWLDNPTATPCSSCGY